MTPSTADRIRKAINAVECMPLNCAPHETMERYAHLEILSMVAHAFLSTYVPPYAPELSKHPDAVPISLDDCIKDIFAHATGLLKAVVHAANWADVSCTPIAGGGFYIGDPCSIPEHLGPATAQARVVTGYDPATRTISLSPPPPVATEAVEQTRT